MKRLDLLLTLVAILFLSSCTSSCTSTDKKLRAMIPDDALGVVKINMPSILEKAGIKKGKDKDAELNVPSSLKTVIDQSNENIKDDLNVIGDVLNNLPESGIDVNNNCYIFLSKGPLQTVALLPLNDEDKAQEMVRKIAGEKMTKQSGIMFVSKSDYAFAIDDDVLLIAQMGKVTNDKACEAAKNIFEKSKSSLLEKEDIAKAIDVENCDITAYIDAEGLPLIFENFELNTAMGSFSPFDILDGSGIKAMTASVNFNDSKKGEERVEIVTDFICGKNSMYEMFYDKVIATAGGGDCTQALDAVPGDFDTYFAVKVNGEELVKFPGISRLIEFIPLNGINISNIVSSIDGTVVGGVQEDNYGVSVQTSSPDNIVNEIVEFANLHGQAPSFNANGEYQYDTYEGDKALVMNKTDDVVYMRCVNYVPDNSASRWKPLVNVLKSSAMALFKVVKMGDKHEGDFCWGLHNKTHGEGFYFTLDDENIALAALKLLCWVEPGSSSYDEDDEEIGLSDY